MSKSVLGWSAVVGAALTAYFALTSAVMWSEPPSAAELAVAHGLAVFAGAVGFVSFVLGCAYLQTNGLEKDEATGRQETAQPT